MRGDVPHITMLVASPRGRHGACAELARAMEEGVRRTGAASATFWLCDYACLPCEGCGACLKGRGCPVASREDRTARSGAAPTSQLTDVLAAHATDALVIWSPVYFSGPPAQFKAMLDRLQVMWADRLAGKAPVPAALRTPLHLCAVGGGGDPFGYGPLATIVHSAMRMLEYELVRTHGFIGFEKTTDAGAFLARARDLGCELAASIRP